MPKPQSRKNSDTRSKGDLISPRNAGEPSLQKIVRENLADIPITDPFAEKQLIRVHPYKLLRALVIAAGTFTRESLRARIVEIYRRCYEESTASEQEKIVTDFVASFPELTFQAGWLTKLIEQHVAARDLRPNGPTNRLLRALANGFRRAAESRPRLNRYWRHTRVDAARSFRTTLQSELSQWGKELDRRNALPDWIDEQVTVKATGLVGTHPCLEPHEQRLQKMLAHGKYYDASVFISAKVFRVRERNLECGESHLRD